MKQFLLIFALLIAACDEKEPIPCKSVAIQFSDANPIQFWPVDCLTYNENEVCGIHPKCWCHPWECEDEIKIQFTDTEENLYSLSIIDSEGSQIDSLDFENIALNGSPGIPSSGGVTSAITLPALSSGVNLPGSHTNWSLGANPTVTLTGSGSKFSNGWANNYAFIEGYSYDFTVDVDYSFAVGTTLCNVYFLIYDSSNTIIYYQQFSVFPGSGTITTISTFTAPANAAKYGFSAQCFSVGSTTSTVDIDSISATQTTPIIPAVPSVPASLFLNYASFVPSNNSPDICNKKIQLKIIDAASPETEMYKSDCIDIADVQKCTTLIEYSNNRNFAGLIYDNVSPEQEFNIRVPAIFFHEQFPEEDEAMELTTGIQKTSGTLKVQRLFDTDYMPYYMHKKLQLIFKHQFITIDGLSWLKEEKYEIQPGERRWPIKKAKCFLTQDYIQRAVL